MEPATPKGGTQNYNTNILNNNHHCNNCNNRVQYKIILIDHANSNHNILEDFIFYIIESSNYFLSSNNITMLSKPSKYNQPNHHQ